MKNWPVICVLALVSQTAGAITTEIPAGTVVNGGDVHTIVTQKFTARPIILPYRAFSR